MSEGKVVMDHFKLKNDKSQKTRKCAAWKRRTLLERYLILLFILLIIVLIVMAGLLIYLEGVYKKAPKEVICTSTDCKEEAGRILSNMDFSVDPCQDFYQFSCGSFMKYESILADEIDSFRNLMDYRLHISRDALEKSSDDDLEFIDKVKKFYKSCITDTAKTVNAKIKEILRIAEIKIWPIETEDEEDQSLEKILGMAIIQEYKNPLFSFYSSYNTSWDYIRINTGDTIFREKYILNMTDEDALKYREKYEYLLIYVFLNMNLSSDVSALAEEFLEFETNFAKITEEERKDNDTMTTITELQSSCPQIKWNELFKYIYNDNEYPEDIKVYSMDYMNDLCQFLEQCKNNNEMRMVKNFIVWKLIAEYLVSIDFHFNQLVYESVKAFRLGRYYDFNAKDKSLKWKDCINDLIRSHLSVGLDYLLLKNQYLYPEKVKKEVEELAEEIKSAMDDMFATEDWLDSYSKDLARKKLSNITSYIGYSNISLNEDNINKVIDKINISESYIENLLFIDRLNFYYSLFNFSDSWGNDMQIRDPFSVTAFFIEDSPTSAVYYLTLGIMFPPFYTQGIPRYLNYPTVGFIIAHEISHGYDSLGEPLRNNDTETYSDETIEKFKEKEACLVNQYSQFPLEGNSTVNGNQTIRDNIADNSGLAQTYAAFQKYLEKHGEQPKLPALDYNNNQMFFIKYAQQWCETVDSPEKTYEHDGHSPGRYRTLVPLMNSRHFAKAFNCPLNSFMNPEKKCFVWG